MTFCHLNLPTFIGFGTKGSISYEYNAAGAKLRKTVTETGKPSKTTDYIGGLVYENNVLQFVPTAEGRMVNSVEKGLLYQYHYKDHLGNVRMTFAPDVPVRERIVLTAEQDSLAKEKTNFANVESVRTNEKGENSTYSVRVSAYSPAVVSKILKVGAGESLALRVAAKYEEQKSILLKNKQLHSFQAKDLLPLLSVVPVNIGSSEAKNYAVGVNILGLLPITKKIINVIKQPIITPKKLQNGVIEVAFYKDSLLQEQIFSKQLSVSENATFDWEKLQDSLVFEQAGFAVVSLKNSSDLPVLFDNLELTLYGTTEAMIVQENHYEPFGMTLRGLDYVLEEKYKNKYLYNGFKVERQEELDLYWDDSHARNYDMQLGSFNTVDPLSEAGQESWSTYHYSYNNPIRYNDPDGKLPVNPIPIPMVSPDALNYLAGAINAWSHDTFGTPLAQNGSDAYKSGQTAGHTVAVVTGTAEALIGFEVAVGSGVATLATGGALAPATVVTAGLGMGATVHGANTVQNAYDNLSKPQKPQMLEAKGGKKKLTLEPEELEKLNNKNKKTLTNEEKQKLKAHHKDTNKRHSSHSGNNKKPKQEKKDKPQSDYKKENEKKK